MIAQILFALLLTAPTSEATCGIYGHHVYVVTDGPGTAEPGDAVLIVAGVSVNYGYPVCDMEILIGDITTAVVDEFFETASLWLGDPRIEFLHDGHAHVGFNWGRSRYHDGGPR